MRGDYIKVIPGSNLECNVILCLAFSPDNTSLAGGGAEDRLLYQWSVWESSTTPTRTFTGHTYLVYSVVYTSPNQMVSGPMTDELLVWDVASGACTQVLAGHTGDPLRLIDGNINPCSTDHAVILWDLQTGACTKVLDEHTGVSC